MKKLLFLLFLTLSYFGSSAQNPQILETSADQKKIIIGKEYIEIYKDSAKVLTLEDVISKEFQKFASAVNYKSKLTKNTTYWLKFKIKNSSSKKGNWMLEFQDIPFIDIFVIAEDGKTTKIRSGTLVPASEKEIKYGIRESVNITLNSKETKIFFVKVTLEVDIQNVNFISISDSKSYHHQMGIDNLVQGIFHGLLWMMLCYNLFLYISTRKKSYLYYVGYVFSFSIFQFQLFGYIRHFIVPEQPDISSYFVISVYLAFLFYFLLMREFTDSQKHHKKLDKVLKIVIVTNIAFILFLLSVRILMGKFYSEIALLFILINMVTLLVLIVIIYIKGDKVAQIFAIGTTVLAISTFIVIVGALLGTNPEHTINYFQGGIVAEVFIFSIGLSYKYKISEQQKQKAQESLILQLTENQQLQTKVNRELEEKVKERTSEIRLKNEEIQSKNKNITASIKYAKRIQTAMLPSDNEVTELLPEHFILFKPRDIVSGDFYWVKKINNKTIIAAADCTGHGIPGAFVSMLGISLLNEIASTEDITTASSILENLRKKVKSSLKQTDKTGSSKDGMDIALCIIDDKTKILQFAGAYNPLYLVREKELTEIKATRNPIGIFVKEKAFENNDIQLQTNDQLYMFSDGYADQFGGEYDKKFMSKKFRELLTEISNKSLQTQKEILNTTIEQWQNGTEQNDDIIVIGLKV